jgi:hypothetical protein
MGIAAISTIVCFIVGAVIAFQIDWRIRDWWRGRR